MPACACSCEAIWGGFFPRAVCFKQLEVAEPLQMPESDSASLLSCHLSLAGDLAEPAASGASSFCRHELLSETLQASGVDLAAQCRKRSCFFCAGVPAGDPIPLLERPALSQKEPVFELHPTRRVRRVPRLQTRLYLPREVGLTARDKGLFNGGPGADSSAPTVGWRTIVRRGHAQQTS